MVIAQLLQLLCPDQHRRQQKCRFDHLASPIRLALFNGRVKIFNQTQGEKNKATHLNGDNVPPIPPKAIRRIKTIIP